MAQEHAQYVAAAAVPLIKSPSLRVPKQVEMPQDIYPLPTSIAEYFAYPFTLEPHVITLESSRKSTIAAHASRREGYLRAREEERARRQREALHRVAPGFIPESGPLVPKRLGDLVSRRIEELMVKAENGADPSLAPTEQRPTPAPQRSVMDDLVDQLVALEAKK